MRLKLADIIIDQTIDIRSRLDEETINRYAESFDELPPVVVFATEEGLLLADGFHRIAAAERLGRKEVEAEKKAGTRDDALEYAAIANVRHGQPLSSDEQREAVRRLNRLHTDWGRKKLATTLGVGEDFVRRTLQSDDVKRHTLRPGAPLKDAHYQEIASAPRETWDDLVEVAAERGWSSDETRAAVQNIKSESIPADYKKQILKGEAEPVRMRDGEPELTSDTIRRRMEESRKGDALGPLFQLLHQAAILEVRRDEDMFSELRRERVEQIAADLDRVIETLQEVRGAAGKQLGKLQAVS